VASQKPSPPEDAIALLMDDHRRFKELFDEFKKLQSSGQPGLEDLKQELMDAVCAELTIHSQIEEELFYPPVREALQNDDLMNEAVVEHESFVDLIDEIKDGDASDDMTCARFIVLGEYVEHHIREEHEDMFPKVRATGIPTLELGRSMLARKEQLKAQMGLTLYDEMPAHTGKPSLWERITSVRLG
jgi:hemerythrin